MDGGTRVKTFAVLVEYQLPDDADFDVAARPLMEALRELSPCPPANVTAFAHDTAERVILLSREDRP